MVEQRRELPKEKCPRCGRANIVVESPNILGDGRQWMKCSKCKWLISRHSEEECWTVMIDTPYSRGKTNREIGGMVDGL